MLAAEDLYFVSIACASQCRRFEALQSYGPREPVGEATRVPVPRPLCVCSELGLCRHDLHVQGVVT